MSLSTFVQRQITQVRLEGRAALFRKLKKGLRYTALGLPVAGFVCAMRFVRPWLLVRIGILSQSIGHFSVDTELHLCERDAGIDLPVQRHVDLYFIDEGIVCNQQLAAMWRRVLRIWPEWFLLPVLKFNRLLPGAAAHELGLTTNEDRDVFNLFDRHPAHLRFTAEEDARGQGGLRSMGIPPGAPYVCLIARDPGYNATLQPVHDQGGDNYRNSDIRNFAPAALELVRRGYFVIRMGSYVREPMAVPDPKIIDYATNGMRSDFMDIYLGATCAFCIGSSTGYLGVPHAFRRPVVTVDRVPLGYLESFWPHTIGITKHHYSLPEGRELTLKEIFERGFGFCMDSACYESKGVTLIANSPEEIRDAAVEMAERIRGTWQTQAGDDLLQRRFWATFPAHALSAENHRPLHGEIRGRFGTAFLRSNLQWLQ